MRRALLTATPPVATALTIGNTGTLGTSAFGLRTVVDLSGPATRSGTITLADFQANGASNAVVMVGSLSGTTYTVRSVSSSALTSTGLNSRSISLAVQAGDYIGLWCTTAASGLRYSATAGKQLGYSTNPGSTPSAGTTIALTIFNDGLASIVGTGI